MLSISERGKFHDPGIIWTEFESYRERTYIQSHSTDLRNLSYSDVQQVRCNNKIESNIYIDESLSIFLGMNTLYVANDMISVYLHCFSKTVIPKEEEIYMEQNHSQVTRLFVGSDCHSN